MNFVQNSLGSARVNERQVKTDEELLAELKADRSRQMTDVTEEFGDEWFWQQYGKLVDYCRHLSHPNGKYETYFTGFIVVTIMLAGILVGIDTYEQLSELPELNALEIFVVIIFALEVLIKVISYGKRPWEYFIGEEGVWNTFDFIVVVFSMPFFSDITGNNSPAIRIVSRVFRLFRVAKIVHQIPALQVIVKGLIGGIKSIVYVVTLLVLIFYIYAVFGVFMFKGNDPFYFRTVPTALLTLFRVCTLENWGENMYINAFGCKEFDGNIYLTQDDVDIIEWNQLPSMYKCDKPTAQFGLALFYFCSFVIFSSLVMLSLFIGVITMSMQESLNDMRKEVEENNRKKKLMKAEEEMEKLAVKNTAMLITQRMAAGFGGSRRYDKVSLNQDGMDITDSDTDTSDSDAEEQGFLSRTGSSMKKSFKRVSRKVSQKIPFLSSKRKGKKSLTAKEKKQIKDMAEMKALLMQAWSGTKASADYHHDLDIAQEGHIEKYVRHAGIVSRNIVEHQNFTNFITIVIIATAILVGVETDYSSESTESIFETLENVVFAIFTVEVILRFLAEDCYVKEYFRSSWNTFDFFVVALSKVPGGGLVIVLLRLVRLLRVLKLVKSLPQLAVIVNALLMGISSIGYISVIMLLTFYLFGILGVLLFRDNDSFNFGQLHLALVALFKVATLDNWGEPLYINVYGCDTYPPYFVPRDKMFKCVNSKPTPGLTVTFFTFFVLIGSLVMITLFVGVVTTSMEEATRLQMVELEIETRIMELCNERSVTPNQLDIYRRVFGMLDLDGGGTIEGEELRSGLQAVNIECSDEQLDVWVKEVDVNSDGVIDLIEFIIFMTNMKKKALEEQEKKAMRKGADAFLRLRKKAQARKAADAQSSTNKVASITETSNTTNEETSNTINNNTLNNNNTSSDTSTNRKDRHGSVMEKRKRRRSSIGMLTMGMFGNKNNENDVETDEDTPPPSKNMSTSQNSPISSPKGSVSRMLSRGLSRGASFFGRKNISDNDDSEVDEVSDASTLGSPVIEKSSFINNKIKDMTTTTTIAEKLNSIKNDKTPSSTTSSDNADITAELSSSTTKSNGGKLQAFEIEDEEHLQFINDLDDLNNSNDLDN
jgi:voltage-gated sodium channel